MAVRKVFNLKPDTQTDTEAKWQPLIVKGENAPAISCTVKAKIDGQVTHLHWPFPGVQIEPDDIYYMRTRSAIDINPDDEMQLIMWYALKTKDKHRIYFMTDSVFGIEPGPDIDPLEISVWFVAREGQLNEKPFRFTFHTGSWDGLSMTMRKD